MIDRIRHGAQISLGRERGREIEVRPDDVFLISYPKSGNTWLRFIVGNLMHPDTPITFDNIEQMVPDIYQHATKYLISLRAPRILKSHEYFDPRYKKVIYIIRDPRDVAVSYYHHHIKFRTIDPNCPLSSFVDRFIAGDLDAYGSWAENVGSWIGARKDNPDFLLLRYEDLLATPEVGISKMAAFLSIPSSAASLQKTITGSSFEQMREMEKQQGANWKPLKHTNKDIPFVRKGPKANWKDELSSSDAGKIENAWHHLMEYLEYL